VNIVVETLQAKRDEILASLEKEYKERNRLAEAAHQQELVIQHITDLENDLDAAIAREIALHFQGTAPEPDDEIPF